MTRSSAFTVWAFTALLLVLVGCQPRAEEWYARGVAAVGRGDYAGAADAFTKAGNLADAPERAADALSRVGDAATQYAAAETAIHERRWYDAYTDLQRVIALDPGYGQAADQLTRVTRELDERFARAEAAAEADDPEKAAAIFGELGDYRDADQRAAQATALAKSLARLHEQMKAAARAGDWATALTSYEALAKQAPAYRDVAKLRHSYLRRSYEAAQRALRSGRQAEALRILGAIITVDPAYRDARVLVEQARGSATQELQGVHSLNRTVGTYLGWSLRLDSVEVRPEGELLVRATFTNVTTLSNHLSCIENPSKGQPTVYLVTLQGQQVLPTQWACQQWKQRDWNLPGGHSTSFWWVYPKLHDVTAPFTLTFLPWGEVKVNLADK